VPGSSGPDSGPAAGTNKFPGHNRVFQASDDRCVQNKDKVADSLDYPLSFQNGKQVLQIIKGHGHVASIVPGNVKQTFGSFPGHGIAQLDGDQVLDNVLNEGKGAERKTP
jgi:hypothetical protein